METVPEGSRLSWTRQGGNEVLQIPQPRRGVATYFIAIFIIVWLGGWAMGFVTAAHAILTKPDASNSWFMRFWLAGWTVGGAFAVLFLFSILRPAVPETVKFSSTGIVYDSGVRPFQPRFSYTGYRRSLRSFFNRRTIKELTASDLRTLQLRETDGGNRLTVDIGAKRIDMATAATEVEREWLYRLLKDRYG